MSRAVELRARVRRYYTSYYRDVLGIPDWAVLVGLREDEERQERGRLDRLRRLLGGDVRGRLLNVGCGTGGFNLVVEEAGARPVGVDADAEAIAICALKQEKGGGAFVRAAAERLPFPDGTFDVVYCFSSIEHVESVEESVAEMVRVTRRGGLIYVHTPNAWSWYEGHYKLLWAPFLPAALGRLYLRARGRPSEYLATLRRLTPGGMRRAFARAGLSDLRFHDDAPPRESLGPLRVPIGLYYRLSGISPFIEVVARKP
ncbi:MAG TPA: class I SAM-dependent methyltransferase [Candidatus Eisenbacteria bacterium]|nr:class I SAM-dependent methyltransferase [Candidatus Eisenbacteria bacterium]